MTTRTHPDSTGPLSVALVTLGCARNEVDSEELAGRLEADGFLLVDDAGRRRHRGGQHLRLRRGGQEGLRRHAARRPPTSRTPVARRPSSPSAAWPSATARSSPTRCPRPTPCSASTTTPTSPPGCARSSPARPTRRTRRRTAAGCCRSRRSTARRPSRAGPRGPTADRRRRGVRPPARAPYAAGSTAARWRRSSWPAAATGAARSARSRASAARSSAAARPTCSHEARWLAEQGVRELFLVSENSTSYGKDLGDLRPARDAAARAGRRRRHRAGPGLLPPAGRDPARAGRGDRDDARRRAVLRPVLPARQRDGAAPDAPLRRPGELPRAARPDPRAGARGRGPLQRDRRLPRRDRGRPRDALRLPGRRPAGRHRRVRLLRRGRHRGRDVRRQARRGRGPRPRRARDRPGRGAHRPARRGADRRGRRGARRERSTDGDVEGRAAHQGPEVDGTTYLRRIPGRRSATWCARSSSTPRVPTSTRGSCDDPGRGAQPSNWNVPNALTTLRIVMVPFFGWALLIDGGDSITVALRGVRALRGRDDHRQDRRRHRPQAQPGHQLRQDRRPDRRQGDHRHGLHRPVDRRRHLVVGDDRGADPRVERDPAAALGAQARRDRRRRPAARSRPPSRPSPCPACCCRSRTARTPTTATSTSSGSPARCSSTPARWRSPGRSR